MLQCFGQSYGSSGGQRIVVDTAVEVISTCRQYLTSQKYLRSRYFHDLVCKGLGEDLAMTQVSTITVLLPQQQNTYGYNYI